MRVETRSNTAKASDDFMLGTLNYTVDSPALVFDVLCSKMYGTPFETMIQEYMANARDAHREVGKLDVPIQLIFPTNLDSHLYIRDFGPGLTIERIKTVFTKLGKSTKNDDDVMTGGFGLGAKIG
jgi:hypothetical protein